MNEHMQERNNRRYNNKTGKDLKNNLVQGPTF